MAKQVLFLYRTIEDKANSLLEKINHGIYSIPNSTVVAIDTESFPISRRKELEQEYYLREFEVEQEKFLNLVKEISKIKARLINIEINYSDYEEDLIEQLKESIDNEDYTMVLNILKKFKEIGRDIQSMEFYINNGFFRVTRLAELDVEEEQQIQYILKSNFVKYLAGLTREVENN